jgi:C-terminal processing protease CtpA/Prc
MRRVGLLDIGDMLHTVDGKPVRGLDLSGVVKLILGRPNSRVSLEVYRENQVVETLPTPVMVAPFSRKEIQLERKLGPNESRSSRVAGVGILFHKVPFFC